MKLWKAHCRDDDGAADFVFFATSRRVASAELRAALKSQPADPAGVEAVEVPTKRAELVAWLNRQEIIR